MDQNNPSSSSISHSLPPISYREKPESKEEDNCNTSRNMSISEFIHENEKCFFSFALEGSKTGVWVYDRENRRVHRSLEHDRIFGYSNLLPEWNRSKFLEHVIEEDRAEADYHMDCAIKDRKGWNIECRIRRADGAIRWIRTTARHRSNSEGKREYITGIVQDITSRKTAEEELRHARDQLEQQVIARTTELEQRARQLARLASELTVAEQRERRRLAEILHDEMQQLLVAARMQIERITHAPPPPEYLQTIDFVYNNLNNAIEISRNLTRDLSAPVLFRSGLQAALRHLTKEMEQKYLMDIDLQVTGPLAELPENLKILLFTASRELLFNSLKHSGTRSATIRVIQNEKTLALEIKDKGKGFNADDVLTCSDNVGFGLFSIRERTELLGGNLIIDSAPGSGSRFLVEVPIQRHDGIEREVDQNDIPGYTNHSIRVLLIDGHKMMREGLKMVIDKHEGLEVVGFADDSMQAFELIESLNPDAVTVNISTPDTDGLETISAIKKRWPNIRIIGLSYLDNHEHAARILHAGVDRFLITDAPSSQLVEAISSHSPSHPYPAL